MATILVGGLINFETTVNIEAFPIDYSPVRYPFFGVKSTVSGVGYNISKALHTLGDDVVFASLLGKDSVGHLCSAEITDIGIDTQYLLPTLDETPQSAILYDSDGRRQINVDLKDIQDLSYPSETMLPLLDKVDLAILCNINWTREFLKIANDKGILLASDVHSIDSLDDDYNRDYMVAADILFMSHENIPNDPEAFAQAIIDEFSNRVVVIGMGSEGALLQLHDGSQHHVPAIKPRPIENTIGAGDSLLSSFLHFYIKDGDALTALQRAVLFASWKIGERGAADGFLTEDHLLELENKQS